jgi:hypothetical protein
MRLFLGLLKTLGGDVENCAAVLTVDRVRVVAFQAAGRALEFHLAGVD